MPFRSRQEREPSGLGEDEESLDAAETENTPWEADSFEEVYLGAEDTLPTNIKSALKPIFDVAKEYYESSTHKNRWNTLLRDATALLEGYEDLDEEKISQKLSRINEDFLEIKDSDTH